MPVELCELLCSGAIRRHQLGENFLTPTLLMMFNLETEDICVSSVF